MIRRPPRSTRTDTLFPYTTLFRSVGTIGGNFFRTRAQAGYRSGNAHPEPVRSIFENASPPENVIIQLASHPGYGSCFFDRSEEHTSELQSLMRISYAVFCLKKKKYCTNEDTHRCNNSPDE